MKEFTSNHQSEIVIIDYPNRLTEKPLTEEGQRIIREASEMMREFLKEHSIFMVNADGKKIL